MSDPNILNYVGISGASLATGLVGKIVYDWLKNNRNNKSRILTEHEHKNLCEIVTLKHERFVQGQFTDLKQNYLEPKFENMFKEIKNNK